MDKRIVLTGENAGKWFNEADAIGSPFLGTNNNAYRSYAIWLTKKGTVVVENDKGSAVLSTEYAAVKLLLTATDGDALLTLNTLAKQLDNRPGDVRAQRVVLDRMFQMIDGLEV
jgi:hypothetical protein